MSQLGIVFDMDDTLYFERDYVRSGFQAVAVAVARGSSVPRQGAFSLMWGLFEEGARGTTFNDLLAYYPELSERYTVADLVTLYREHAPTISFMPQMMALLGGTSS